MAKFLVQKSAPLRGEVKISGSKNAVLPIMAAALLTEEKCVIKDVPALRDVDVMCRLLESLGAKVYVTTVDGSEGTKGFVTDVMKDLDYSFFYTCGPMPMFKAIEKTAKTSGQFSFEERMGCGFGACMGCSCKTLTGGYKRICKDGPVMLKEEILWED